jgi:non-ribosomal peptide synthetase component F
LKAALDLDSEPQKTDAELAAEIEQGGIWVGELTPEAWTLIVRHEARAMVLNAVVGGGWEAVEAVLVRLWAVEARGRPLAA